MKAKNETTAKVNEYIHLRSVYLAFCALAKKELGKSNPLDVTFGRVDNVAVDIVALDRSLRMRLGLCEFDEQLRGVIIFERILAGEKTRPLLEVFFDGMANAYEKRDDAGSNQTLKSVNTISRWILLRLIDALLKDMLTNRD